MKQVEVKDQYKRERVEKLKKLNNDAFSYRYLIEDQVTDAITEGNRSMLEDTLRIINLDEMLEYLGEEGKEFQLRNFKNHLYRKHLL